MTMTHEEAIKMQGTEFIYEFTKSDTIKGYVKKVDIEKGKISLWSFSLTTDQGYKFDPLNDEEEKEGACCLYFNHSSSFSDALKVLEEIRDTGKHKVSFSIGSFNGCAF